MKFSEIKEFTYIGNKVIVNGIAYEIDIACDCDAVQYHKGRPMLQEPTMVEVPSNTYQYALDKWNEADLKAAEPDVLIVVPITSTPNTPEEKILQIEASITKIIETRVKSLDYEGTDSIAKYQGYENPYRTEAEALGLWIALTWQYAYTELQKVEAGTREIPLIAEILMELPVYGA